MIQRKNAGDFGAIMDVNVSKSAFLRPELLEMEDSRTKWRCSWRRDRGVTFRQQHGTVERIGSSIDDSNDNNNGLNNKRKIALTAK